MSALKVKSGDVLVAQPFMNEGPFKRSVIGMTEHGKEGSVGFILNKPVEVKLTELVEDVKSEEDFLVHYGGPVATDTIHYMHNLGDLLEESVKIKPGLYWGGNFEKLMFLIESGLVLRKNIRFYIGYSGWSDGQLDDELQGGTWVVSDWYPNYTFQSKPKQLWSQALGHKGDTFTVIAKIPDQSNQN